MPEWDRLRRQSEWVHPLCYIVVWPSGVQCGDWPRAPTSTNVHRRVTQGLPHTATFDRSNVIPDAWLGILITAHLLWACRPSVIIVNTLSYGFHILPLTPFPVAITIVTLPGAMLCAQFRGTIIANRFPRYAPPPSPLLICLPVAWINRLSYCLCSDDWTHPIVN